MNKFYKAMYAGRSALSSIPLQAVQLWSDWNAGVLRWSKERVKKNSPSDPHSGFGYMLLHTEDLVAESIPIKFAAIKQLAQWVKSNASNDYLCCLAVKGSNFLGSHDGTSRKALTTTAQHAQLQERFGKWRSHVDKDKQLGIDLHKYGKDGLELLGYEPRRKQADDNSVAPDGYRCKLTPEQCGVAPVKLAKCTLVQRTDYRGGKVDIMMTSASSPENCCQACQEMDKCSHFTYDIDKRHCYLKRGTGVVISGESAANLVSGHFAAEKRR